MTGPLVQTLKGRDWPAAAAGLVAAGAAIGFQELLHLAVPAAPFAPHSIGERIVRHTPGGVATWAIDLLGHWALRLLGALIVLCALGLGAALGRQPPWIFALVALLLSLLAAALDPTHPSLFFSVAAGLVAGGAALTTRALLRGWRGGRIPFDGGRRQLLASIAWGAGALALGGAAAWRVLRPLITGAVVADRPIQVTPDASFDAIAGLSPLVTSRMDHYVVEIDLDAPVIAEQDWHLQVHGAVAHPLSLTLDDLRGMFTVERLINMSCISNTVGGPLVGNAVWTGVSLAELLNRAVPAGEARSLMTQGADGYFDVVPLDVARQPEALVAFGMDGELLPREHGFPARLLLPGRYGFKSVKWLQEIEVLTISPMGYWEQRGWDADGIIRTESRFDVPADHSQVRSPFIAAGVAWAGTRGVSRVEVSHDDGRSWRTADLEPTPDVPSWRRWRIMLRLSPGVYPLSVRAADGAGRLQDTEYRAPHPSGASGYHRIVVTVVGGSASSPPPLGL